MKYVGFAKNAIGDLIDMYNYSDIRSIHLEVTQNCQANCPMCDRNMNGEGLNPHINLDELSLEDCKKIFLPEFVAQLDTMYMCGNLGDPIVARDTLEIFKYFREHNPAMWLSMNTNAGAKSVAWWKELALVINKKGAVIFSVDGVFINAGGRARWDFLIFEHNQHQIDEAEALATKWGCEKFMKKKTGRFITGKGEKKQSHQAVDKKGNNSTEIKKPKKEYTNNALSKQDVILNKYGSMDTYYDAAPIICKVKKDNSLFITAEGLALPCCWTAGRMYKWWHKDPKVEQIWDFIPNISALQARNGLEAVFDTGIFDSIQASWNKPSCGTGKLKVCAMKCGAEFDPFAEQFK